MTDEHGSATAHNEWFFARGGLGRDGWESVVDARIPGWRHAGLRVAEVTEIRRQEREEYRKAVAALSVGDLRTAFRRLDDLGAIIEIADDAERYRLLAQDFLELSRKGSVPLVVSPTHGEGAKVTEAIRGAKRDAGKLGPERSVLQFHNLQWEEPDRRRAENYCGINGGSVSPRRFAARQE